MQKPNKVPTVSPTAHVATNATVIGDVTIGDECCVLFNAAIRGDCDSFVRLGERTNVQEGACLHVSHGSPTIIGHDVTIGHAAVVHGCTVGDHSLIGMGATVLDNAVVASGCIVAAGALVLSGAKLEPNSVYAGVPARKVKEITPEQREEIILRIARDYRMYASWYEEGK